MKDTETADNLLQAIAILSSRGSSGRLQIKAGATRGAFFFRQGKLVDARMGPFTGFSAINLAVSLGETCQSFDPSIQPPDSCFTDSTERTIIRERFGIDTFDLEVVANQPVKSKERERTCEALEATSAGKQGSAAEKEEIEATKELPKPEAAVFSAGATGQAQNDAGPTASTTQQRQARKTRATLYRTHYARLRRLLALKTHERFALRAGFIILVVIPVAVVAASYWTESKQASPQFRAFHPLKAESSQVPAPSPEGPALATVTTVVPEPNRTARKAEVPVNNDVRPRSEAVSDRPSKTVNSPSDDTPIEHSPSDKALSRTVVVVVEIAEGHVTQAYIQNPQAGLGGYESTALRMARERRYPKDKKGKEMVVLKVTGRQKL